MRAGKKRLYVVITAAMLFALALTAAVLLHHSSAERNDVLLQNARESYSRGDFENALLYLRRAGKQENSTEIRMLMADCYEALENYERALDILRQMDTADPAIAARIQSIEQKRELMSKAEAILIAGQEYERNTREANLDNRGVADEDLMAISSLYSLDRLSLADNTLTDLRLLASLGGLDELNLAGNRITDLSPLSGLKELRVLNLNRNPVSDFTPLYSLSTLNTLHVIGTRISKEELFRLSTALPQCAICYEENGVKQVQLGAISFQTDVQELNLSGIGIRELNVLEDCTELKILNISGNEITDLKSLMMLSKLEKLDISGNSIADLRPLIGLPMLFELYASDNLIAECSAVGSLSSLRKLDLCHNPIADYSGLGKLVSLETLLLKDCGVTDAALPELYGLTLLTHLDLTNNRGLGDRAISLLREALPSCGMIYSELVYEIDFSGHMVRSDESSLAFPSSGITSLTGLEQMTNLTDLDLSHNQLTSVYNFEISPSRLTLKRLNLSDNQLKDIQSLGTLSELVELDLSSNQIENVYVLTKLSKLISLNLSGNLISEEQRSMLSSALPGCFIIF